MKKRSEARAYWLARNPAWPPLANSCDGRYPASRWPEILWPERKFASEVITSWEGQQVTGLWTEPEAHSSPHSEVPCQYQIRSVYDVLNPGHGKGSEHSSTTQDMEAKQATDKVLRSHTFADQVQLCQRVVLKQQGGRQLTTAQHATQKIDDLHRVRKDSKRCG